MCWALGESLSVEEITVDPPKEYEVSLSLASARCLLGALNRCHAVMPRQPYCTTVTAPPSRLSAAQVRLRVVSTSFCHSDLHGMQGLKVPGLVDVHFPAVFGHEGAAVVESCGPMVTSVVPGGATCRLGAWRLAALESLIC